MSRYLQARPGGVLAWLSVRQPCPERQLFEHLLGAPEAVELNVPALAAALDQPVPSVARALFALHRQASIAVQEGAAAASPAVSGGGRRGLAGLDQDLRDISQAHGEILLASQEGFCIAQAGLSAERAQSLAAQLPLGNGPALAFRVQLRFGDRTLHLCASPGIDLRHPVMLRLGAHLVQGLVPALAWPHAAAGKR